MWGIASLGPRCDERAMLGMLGMRGFLDATRAGI